MRSASSVFVFAALGLFLSASSAGAFEPVTDGRAAAAILLSGHLKTATAARPQSRRAIVVSPDGAGQFASIRAAVESVKDASAQNPVDVVIKPGTYRETVTTRDWVNLVGQDRDRCVIRYGVDLAEARNAHKYHVLWATSNSSIKNLTDCLVDAQRPIYFHNWNDQKGSCSMTLEKCRLAAGNDYALHIVALGSNHRDFFVIHDSVLKSSKKSIDYTNATRTDAAGVLRWHGKSEIELIGSGNQIDGIELVPMQDDAGKRLSGVALCRGLTNPVPLKKP